MDNFYLGIVEVVSQESHATDKKVGALIVKDGNILSFSYNGTPSGWDNNTEDKNGITKDIVYHAESQAIAKLARQQGGSNNSTLYTSLSPCLNCAKLIVQAGISRVVYKTPYKCSKGLDFLKQNNVAINDEPPHCNRVTIEWLQQTGLL